jgi:DNA-binding response OmpR family regulator
MMLQVLVVEDEWLLAEGLKINLEERGCVVLGPAFDCTDALAILEHHRPYLAFVDTQLGDESCEEVLAKCDTLGIPVIVFTGHIEGTVPDYARGRQVLAKPYEPSALDDLLSL